MPITVIPEGQGKWIVRSAYADKDVVKAAGARWDRDRKTWWTDKPEVAAKLANGDAAAIALINAERLAQHERTVAAIEASRAADADIDIPAPAGLTYLPYQRAGIAYAKNRRSTLFGDAMGLGKSGQAIGTVVSSDGSPAIVVCPASLKLNWRNEIKKFLPGEGWVLLLQGKPSPEISNHLSSLFALGAQVGQQPFQKDENINHIVQSDYIAQLPRYLRLWRLPFSDANLGSIEIGGNELHDALMCIVHRNAPTSRIGVFDDGSFAVKKACDVGQNHGVGGHRQAREAFVSPDKAPGASSVVAVEDAVRHAEFMGDSEDSLASGDALDGSVDDRSAEFIPARGVDGEAASPQQASQSRSAVAHLGGHMGEAFAGIDALGETRQIGGGQSGGGHLFLVCNYDVLADWLPVLSAVPAKTIIFDEIHYAKSRKAKRTIASMALVKAHAHTRILGLTGTPILNRPAELIEPLRILGMFGQVGGSWNHFVTRFCAGHQTRYGWDISGASHLDELQVKLRANGMIRRLKEDVLPELPGKRRQILALEPESEGARKAIAAEWQAWKEREERIAELSKQVEAAKDTEAYKAAVAALSEGYRVAFTEMTHMRRAVAEAKLPQAMEVLEDAVEASKKVVCFAHHHSIIDAVVERFGQCCVKLDGRDSLDARQSAVDRFQNDPAIALFMGQITAAGVGITLTAASHVLFLEGDWSPGNLAQAEDRVHRLGQRNSVLVQHLVLDGSLDARMAQLIIEKMDVIEKAIDARAAADATVQAPAVIAPPRPLTPVAPSPDDLSPEQVEAVHSALKALAGLCDGARALDEAGFARFDVKFGHDLAARASLTPRQAIAGKKLVLKYHRQLPAELLAVIRGDA
jgi:Helicase conserved C-terminal domain/SNF2-related domain